MGVFFSISVVSLVFCRPRIPNVLESDFLLPWTDHYHSRPAWDTPFLSGACLLLPKSPPQLLGPGERAGALSLAQQRGAAAEERT